ncbi:ArpU family phage packaging/lysis transcriptional regulator [Priestia endophytica]|uniref:ArpU family phage packaging/lysis transcriptional regulator n=1 Tax=Priestia endophytica TaxID=135735 RepID=UPI000DCA6701|nr:ArpU family phage packaging/lysis transcriptional regulator [Priestia endophytica]RAS75721.1 ArpU family transcriptional regulator [Priestia endophytica]
MNQLSFTLPKINREKTRKVVEGILEKYRLYLLQFPETKLPKVTATYSLVPPHFGSEFHSSTETAAIERVDYERERDAFLKRVQQAVNRLSFKERQIIIERYMDFEEKYDYEVYNELGMSERGYYRVKGRAFYKLAFALNLNVFEEGLLEAK